MRSTPILALIALLFFCSAAAPATAPAPTSNPSGQDKLSVTHGQITINNQAISYQATAGTYQLADEAGKPRANFFFVSYVKESAADVDPSTRPITFFFNGGPGAAAVWLHVGAAGPKRITLTAVGEPTAPPHVLVDNPQSWLDATDMVFIDPVGTGYSRAAEGQKAEDFYGVENDVASCADFIRLYLTRNQRWLSPKYLAGESYGGTRAAALAEHLLDRYGIDVSGIILISPVLDFQTIQSSGGNDLPFALFVPSYTAVAGYHHKLADHRPMQTILPEVENWAMTTYLAALAKGGSLAAKDRQAIVTALAGYTGLPEPFIDKSNLRISPEAFRKQLLNDQRKILGRFDARLLGSDADPAESDPDYDPSLSGVLPMYAAAFNDYVRRTLKFESDLPYEILSDRVGPWDFGRHGMGYLNVTGPLRDAMLKNPRLRIFFASGYYDLATPYMGVAYTVSHLDKSGQLTANISQSRFDSGHMVYHPQAALEKLKSDVSAFIQTGNAPRP